MFKLDDIRVIPHRRHVTKTEGKPNGFMREIASPRDGFEMQTNAQVYLTTVNPGSIKGWHTHAKKTGHLSLITGIARIVFSDGYVFLSVYNPVSTRP